MFRPTLIKGGSHTDQRGTISFFNDFYMQQVKRFYYIENAGTQSLRGWRGHKIEQRWFNVCSGAFLVRLIHIDNWETPDQRLPVEEFLLHVKDNMVLHIPAGYASCIQALEDHSKLIVFADYDLEHAKLDDYLFPVDYFKG